MIQEIISSVSAFVIRKVRQASIETHLAVNQYANLYAPSMASPFAAKALQAFHNYHTENVRRVLASFIQTDRNDYLIDASHGIAFGLEVLGIVTFRKQVQLAKKTVKRFAKHPIRNIVICAGAYAAFCFFRSKFFRPIKQVETMGLQIQPEGFRISWIGKRTGRFRIPHYTMDASTLHEDRRPASFPSYPDVEVEKSDDEVDEEEEDEHEKRQLDRFAPHERQEATMLVPVIPPAGQGFKMYAEAGEIYIEAKVEDWLKHPEIPRFQNVSVPLAVVSQAMNSILLTNDPTQLYEYLVLHVFRSMDYNVNFTDKVLITEWAMLDMQQTRSKTCAAKFEIPIQSFQSADFVGPRTI